MIIKEIKQRSLRSIYFLVKIEGHETICLNKETIQTFKLKAGQDVSQEEITTWTDETEFLRAKNSALYSLGRRDHSKHELETKLKQKGYQQIIIKRVLERLTELGFIDDQKFTGAFIQSQLRRKHFGKHRLIQALRQKGISRDEINTAISQTDLEAENHCKISAEKKINQLRRETDPVKKKQKLIAYLMRQGFEWEIIQKTLQAYGFGS